MFGRKTRLLLIGFALGVAVSAAVDYLYPKGQLVVNAYKHLNELEKDCKKIGGKNLAVQEDKVRTIHCVDLEDKTLKIYESEIVNGKFVLKKS